MHHIIDIRKAPIWIYRSSLIFCFTLSMGCGSGCCPDHQNKKLPGSDQQTSLSPQNLLEKSNATQKNNQSKGVDTVDLHGSNDPNQVVKVRVTKVPGEKLGIVLFHGLNRLSYDFDKMKAALQQKFPHATIVALTSVNKDPRGKGTISSLQSGTMRLSIERQAYLAYKEIIKKIGPGKHIVMVGHSQGGLRAFTMFKEYWSRLKSKYGIVIEELITIGTPWKGAPILDRTKKPKEFMEEFNRIKDTLDAIQQGYSMAMVKYFFKIDPNFIVNYPGLFRNLRKYGSIISPGVTDLEPGSTFIREVASGLKEVDLPITAIAGVLTDFSQLFNSFSTSISKKKLNKLNATYAKLIGGDQECGHDMLLPVATQLAEGLTIKNFKRIKVYGACHGNKVGVSVKPGLSELNNNKVIEQVVKCVEAAFYQEKEKEIIENKGYASLAA